MPTQAVSVSNPGFLLDRLAADCAPLQEYRELTQNAIEAVQRAIGSGLIEEGEVSWDVDWPLLESKGFYKLCIIDNGDGMTPEDIRQYINKLAVAGAGDNHRIDGNYGVGAKITAGARNPHGVTYQSWKDGQGTLARFWRDPDEHLYGLSQWELKSGEFAHSRPIGDDLKPESIATHGTKVVLLGHEDAENTALAPSGASHANHWLTRYLNRRYFEFPPSVTVRVREFSKSDPSEWPGAPTSKAAEGAQWRTVTGHKANLDKYSSASGQRSVAGATLHWWLLDDSRPGFTDQNRYWHASGHTAALHKGELYELKEGQTARRALMSFGVVFGTMKVVVYAEPHESPQLTTNTARSVVLLDGEPLPWEEWAEEFRRDLPTEIEDMMAAVLAGTSVDSHQKSIRERLKVIRHLFRLTRYRRTSNGDTTTTGNVPGGSPSAGTSGGSAGGGTSGGAGGTTDDLYGEFVGDDSDDSATAVVPRLTEPQTEWRSIDDKTREPGQMEDRAAEYVRELHTIFLNGDFRVFTDMIDHFKQLYEGIDGAEVLVVEAVREWFEQQLVETVLGVRALEGGQQWDATQIEASLTPESLTAAVMPRYHVHNAIKRQLGSQLRSIKELQAADA